MFIFAGAERRRHHRQHCHEKLDGRHEKIDGRRWSYEEGGQQKEKGMS